MATDGILNLHFLAAFGREDLFTCSLRDENAVFRRFFGRFLAEKTPKSSKNGEFMNNSEINRLSMGQKCHAGSEEVKSSKKACSPLFTECPDCGLRPAVVHCAVCGRMICGECAWWHVHDGTREPRIK